MTLLELFRLLKKHLRLVILLPVVCALVVGLYSVFFVRNTYTATASMYVLAQGESSSSTNLYSDLNASQMLTNDVAKLLKSDRIVDQVGSEVGVEELKGYKVDVTSETTSRVITLSVTGSDPQTAADIVNKMIKDVSDVARSVMNIRSVNPINQAQAPISPSGPNRLLYTVVAFLVGLFAAIVIVVVADMLNTRVRGPEDLEELIDVPVIGRIPTIEGGR
ncbi:YveK family protein [Atopobium sp. oral taxon 416]|uniref:YveK family protein n=1 Tax=Atopobium sp. oral taxon 416 TaxID=712157 RepID=UPI001BAD4C61|nr:Wzz/FepE/Etk N-terminal domain-containing protein [Atopobium sp. oral taxon 416]QUC03652.1 lipopolysaccharide biosynthesis protein [Atopobium sp. oral taxon 416]